jgi:hypothetical protein
MIAARRVRGSVGKISPRVPNASDDRIGRHAHEPTDDIPVEFMLDDISLE